MPDRLFLVPKVGNGITENCGPKYFWQDVPPPQSPSLIAGTWGALDCDECMLVGATVTAGELASISANSDCVLVPANLDGTVGANLATAQTALEAQQIPAGWITSGMTWRTVVRWITRYFLIRQSFPQIHAPGQFFNGSFTLDSTIASLTQAQRNKLTAAANALHLDSSGVTGGMTLRAALKTVADQLPFAPSIGPVTL